MSMVRAGAIGVGSTTFVYHPLSPRIELNTAKGIRTISIVSLIAGAAPPCVGSALLVFHLPPFSPSFRTRL